MMNDFPAIGKHERVAGVAGVRRKSLYRQDIRHHPTWPPGRFRRLSTWLEV